MGGCSSHPLHGAAVAYCVGPTIGRTEESNRLLPDGAADSATRIARVAQQCLYENYPQMIEKLQWLPNNSPNLNTMEISCLGSDVRSYFETVTRSSKLSKIKVATGAIGTIFRRSNLAKLSRVLEIA